MTIFMKRTGKFFTKTENKMVNLEITKEKFVSLLKSVEDQLELDRTYCDKLGEVLHPHIGLYDNSALFTAILELLEEAFDDVGGWIGYFCWELDFGRAYDLGCATREDKSNIDLSSAEVLYDFLIERYER